MISAALAALHARRWLVELVLVLALVGGVWWLCAHLIEVGVQRQKDDDARAYAQLQRKADLETGRLQGVADAAEKAREKEHNDLADYRRQHPLHGGLCLARNLPAAPGTEARPADESDDGAGAAPGAVQSLPAGNSGAGGPGDPDVRHLLDVFAGRADILSAGLREYQARN